MENKNHIMSSVGLAIVGAVATTAIELIQERAGRKDREAEIRRVVDEMQKKD